MFLYSIRVPDASSNLEFIRVTVNLYKMKPITVSPIFIKSDGLRSPYNLVLGRRVLKGTSLGRIRCKLIELVMQAPLPPCPWDWSTIVSGYIKPKPGLYCCWCWTSNIHPKCQLRLKWNFWKNRIYRGRAGVHLPAISTPPPAGVSRSHWEGINTVFQPGPSHQGYVRND